MTNWKDKWISQSKIRPLGRLRHSSNPSTKTLRHGSKRCRLNKNRKRRISLEKKLGLAQGALAGLHIHGATEAGVRGFALKADIPANKLWLAVKAVQTNLAKEHDKLGYVTPASKVSKTYHK